MKIKCATDLTSSRDEVWEEKGSSTVHFARREGQDRGFEQS